MNDERKKMENKLDQFCTVVLKLGLAVRLLCTIFRSDPSMDDQLRIDSIRKRGPRKTHNIINFFNEFS